MNIEKEREETKALKKAIHDLFEECDLLSEEEKDEFQALFTRCLKLGAMREQLKLEGCVVVPVKSCKWTEDEGSNWWTECGEGFVFNEDPHPHYHNFKNCCFCGGLLEAARGGNE